MSLLYPEAQLLLCCARACIDAATEARINTLVQSNLDWVKLVEMGQRHKVSPLLYKNLNAICSGAIPEAVLTQLRNLFRANTIRNRFRVKELIRLLKLLEEQGIPAIPYKGPVLAETIYGDPTLREYRDLDILVQKHNVLRAKDLFISKGYRLADQSIPANGATILRSFYNLKFQHDDAALKIELHWAFTPNKFFFPLDIASVWEHAEPETFNGESVLNIAPDYLLLILCVHAAKHDWCQLAWLTDIAELIRSHQYMDWEMVVKQAANNGTVRILLLGCLLANELLDVPLPDQIRQRIQQDSSIKTLSAPVQNWLFFEVSGLRGDIITHKFHIMLRERYLDKIRYLFRNAIKSLLTPTAKDQALLPLPKSLHIVYYLLRPIRLVKLYGWKSVKELCGF